MPVVVVPTWVEPRGYELKVFIELPTVDVHEVSSVGNVRPAVAMRCAIPDCTEGVKDLVHCGQVLRSNGSVANVRSALKPHDGSSPSQVGLPTSPRTRHAFPRNVRFVLGGKSQSLEVPPIGGVPGTLAQFSADERDVGLALECVDPQLGATRLPGKPRLHACDRGAHHAGDVQLLVRRVGRNDVEEVNLRRAAEVVGPIGGCARQRRGSGRRQSYDNRRDNRANTKQDEEKPQQDPRADLRAFALHTQTEVVQAA